MNDEVGRYANKVLIKCGVMYFAETKPILDYWISTILTVGNDVSCIWSSRCLNLHSEHDSEYAAMTASRNEAWCNLLNANVVTYFPDAKY